MARTITGRAYQTPRFWVWAALSTVPLLFLSLLLAVWATFFARNDSARSAQVAWAIVLTVVGLGPLALRGRTGTTMCDEGLRRHFLFHVVQLRWEDIEGFSDERAFARTRGVSRTSVVAVRVRARPPVASIAVPSELHTTSSDKARALAEYLNRYFRHDTVDGASDIDSAVDDNSAVRTKWSRI